MFRTLIFCALCFSAACRSSSAPEPAPEPEKRQFVSGDQWFKLAVEGIEYKVEYVLPPGDWDGPRKADSAMIEYSQGPQLIWVSLGEIPDFDADLVEVRKLTETEPFRGAEIKITEPGRRADLAATFQSEDGIAFVNRYVNLRPNPDAPVGVGIFHQAPEQGPAADLELVVRSVRVTRK